MTALLAFAGMASVMVAFAWSRTNARKRAFSALAQRIGFRTEEDGVAVRQELAALPSMQERGRIMVSHAIRSGDEVVADWRVVRHPKDRPRDRQRVRTLVAVHRAGARFPSLREKRDDVEPGGVGPVWIESGGEWLACHSRDRRVPNESLLAFRERARILLETPPAGADGAEE